MFLDYYKEITPLNVIDIINVPDCMLKIIVYFIENIL